MRMLRTVQIRLCAGPDDYSRSWSYGRIWSRWLTASGSSMDGFCMSQHLPYEISFSWGTETALTARRFGGGA